MKAYIAHHPKLTMGLFFFGRKREVIQKDALFKKDFVFL